jgi:acetyl-CoA decarbonylase/synthase complex subunit delta
MDIPDVRQKWPNVVYEVTIGRTSGEDGTRASTATIGGCTGLPFLRFEGEYPHRQLLALEVWDVEPKEWHEQLGKYYEDVWHNPGEWAKKCAEEFDADMICLRLQGCDPDGLDMDSEHAAGVVRQVLEAVSCPVIIWGCGNDEKDNEIFTAVSQAAAGEQCLLGAINQDNYRTLVALCKADKHKVIAESPVDINIAKQVNILATDTGLMPEDIVIYPSTGALGYGIEYVYSIMERGRQAGLSGDALWAMPILADIGKEVWKIKEATASTEAAPEWGPQEKRGPVWEAITGLVYLQAGADVIVMRHPLAVQELKSYVLSLVE